MKRDMTMKDMERLDRMEKEEARAAGLRAMKTFDQIQKMRMDAQYILDREGLSDEGDRADVVVQTLSWVLGEASAPLRLSE